MISSNFLMVSPLFGFLFRFLESATLLLCADPFGSAINVKQKIPEMHRNHLH